MALDNLNNDNRISAVGELSSTVSALKNVASDFAKAAGNLEDAIDDLLNDNGTFSKEAKKIGKRL